MSDENDIELSADQVEKFFSTGGEIEETPSPVADEPVQEVLPETQEPVAEPAGENEVQQPDEADTPPWVKGAIAEERGRRREAEDRAKRLEETFQQLLGRMAGDQPQEQVEPPSYEEQVGMMSRRLEAFERQQQATQALQQLQNVARAKEQEFTQAQPDYPQAFAYAAQNRSREYEILGYSKDQAAQLVNNEFYIMVNNALARNENPAKSIYEYAKFRGFNTATNEPKVDAAASLANIQKGQAAARTLSQVPNEPSTGEVTLEMISELSDDEIDALWDKMRKAG